VSGNCSLHSSNILEVGATIPQQIFYVGHSNQKLMLKVFFESYDNVYHEFIQGMCYKKTSYRNIFYHQQEAVHCEHPHLQKPGKQAAPNY
jgi:hypothetical protein